MKQKEEKGWDYLSLSLLAFAGLGLELLLVLIEPMFFKAQMQEWSTTQTIIHWIATCILWGVMAVWLLRLPEKADSVKGFMKKRD